MKTARQLKEILADLDIDVLVQPRSLVHFTGAARHTWMHAIRAGVQVDGAGPGGARRSVRRGRERRRRARA